MASDSIFRMAVIAASCSVGWREYMCSRMSVVRGIEIAALQHVGSKNVIIKMIKVCSIQKIIKEVVLERRKRRVYLIWANI